MTFTTHLHTSIHTQLFVGAEGVAHGAPEQKDWLVDVNDSRLYDVDGDDLYV